MTQPIPFHADDLRIGNYVLGGMVRALRHGAIEVIAPPNGPLKVMAVAEGEPLTEKWFKLMGFEATETVGVYRRGKIFASLNSFAIELDFPTPNIVILSEIEFVHELQNLCFDLTGEQIYMVQE